MATIKDQLLKIFSEVLPENPKDAIKANELIRRIREKIPTFEYADDTIRATISTMVNNDPTSPITKRPYEQGYYLRTEDVIGSEKTKPDDRPRDEQKEEKFRSIFSKYESVYYNRFIKMIEHTRGAKVELGFNKWKYPDLVMVDWGVVEDIQEEGFKIDPVMLEIRRSLGEQPFRLISTELKVRLSFEKLREYFFQCVSNSLWAHSACLAIASEIEDDKLEAEIVRLSNSYNVMVITYGMQYDEIDKMPDAETIKEMKSEEFENIITKNIHRRVVSSSTGRDQLDWDQIKDLRIQNKEFGNLFEWLSRCLSDKKAYDYDDYEKLKKITG